MKKTLPILLITALILLFSNLNAQKTFTISGYIEQDQSKEKLISAAVVDVKSRAGVVTNTFGFYSLTLPQGKTTLLITYIGYQPQQIEFNLRRDTVVDFQLKEGAELKTVEISAKKQDRIENQVQTSRITIPIEQIKKIPALLGEVDVLKALQLLPGVQAGGEGQNGLYVRGGSPDQNLILLDGVPVYNVSHIGGLFSVFNGDAIKNVTLTKGGFPARYGGRLSSIIEIDMKEGNMQDYHGEGGIGIISSRLSLEGPIVKNKASFMISGRRTYIDFIAKPFIKAAAASSNAGGGRGGQGISNSTNSIDLSLYFYDLNAKMNWKINNKHRLYLSAYNGRDIFGADIKQTDATNTNNYNITNSGINWGNITTAFRWNYLFSNKLFVNTTATYSKYQLNSIAGYERKRDTTVQSATGKYISGIEDWAGRMDFDYLPNPKHRIRFGWGATYHTYNPGAVQLNATIRNINIDTALGSTTTYSTEPIVYAEDEIQLGALKANIGIHASAFGVQGTWYNSIQPRINLNYPLSNSVALKASFATMKQYINLLTNENIGLPTDLWVPATARIKPQESWQAVLGAAKTVQDEYEVSVEAYYKKMKNVISYKEGASFFGQQTNWEDKIVQGQGKAYGLELFVQKKEGRLTGWVGYTLSWNKRQFDAINSGIEYPFKYDRRHDFKVVGSYKFSETFSFTGTWVYGTGNSITLYTDAFTMPTITTQRGFDFNSTQYAVSSVGERNAYRMPTYHRLDVGFEWKKKKKHYVRTWTVGAYNAYNRANPYSLFQDSQVVNGRDVPIYRQFSLIPIIPSVSWSFKF
jgi:TonB-dependent Receptor Plug Domain/CarboxypepD_reg-like domain